MQRWAEANVTVSDSFKKLVRNLTAAVSVRLGAIVDGNADYYADLSPAV